MPLIVAFAIHRRVPGWRFFRATIFLPAVYATVVIGILTATVLQLDGPLNQVLGGVGLDGLQREWLGSASTSIPLILIVVVWTNFGYNVLLYLAGMSAIDPSLEEAARIDGAGWMRILVSVIAPNLRRVLEIVLVVNTIAAFAFMFTYVYTITNGGPGTDTYVSEFYIYQQAFTNQNMGYAAAIGVVLVGDRVRGRPVPDPGADPEGAAEVAAAEATASPPPQRRRRRNQSSLVAARRRDRALLLLGDPAAPLHGRDRVSHPGGLGELRRSACRRRCRSGRSSGRGRAPTSGSTSATPSS